MQRKTSRKQRHVPHQRRVEKEFRKKYKGTILEGRKGDLAPPTIWSYRKALLFNAASAQDRGIEEGLSTRIGEGSYRTNAATSSDDHH